MLYNIIVPDAYQHYECKQCRRDLQCGISICEEKTAGPCAAQRFLVEIGKSNRGKHGYPDRTMAKMLGDWNFKHRCSGLGLPPGRSLEEARALPRNES